MRHRLLVPALGGLCAIAALPGRAQAPVVAPPIGPVSSMTTPAAAGAAQPNLAADARGRVFLTWLEPRDGGGHRFRLSSLAGSAWSPPVTIAEGRNFLANWADFPSLFVATDGTLAAHWLERGPSRAAYFVRVATSMDGGATWSAPITPHRDASATEHGFVSFFDAPGGGVGLVWLDGRELAGGAQRGAMTLRSTVLRNAVAGDEMVVDPRVCDCCQTSAARADDAVLVAYRDRSDREIRDTSIVRFADGAWSAPITVHADNWEIHGCPVNGPVVAAAGQAAAVAWFTGAGDEPKAFVAFSGDAGRTFDPPIRFDAGVTLGRLALVLPSAGRAIVTSLERADGGARIVLRDVRRDGRLSEPVPIAAASPDRASGFARVVRTGNRLVFAWTHVQAGAPTEVRTAAATLR